MSALLQLAERVENATADEQRTILGEVWHTLFPRPSELVASPQHWNKRLNRFRKMLDAEAFESAAMTLKPKGWSFTIRSKSAELEHPGYPKAICFAATPGLSLCGVALKARASAPEGGDAL